MMTVKTKYITKYNKTDRYAIAKIEKEVDSKRESKKKIAAVKETQRTCLNKAATTEAKCIHHTAGHGSNASQKFWNSSTGHWVFWTIIIISFLFLILFIYLLVKMLCCCC